MKPVVFDLDGVLVDSAALYQSTVLSVLNQNGYGLSLEQVARARVAHVQKWVDALVPRQTVGRDEVVRDLTARVRGAIARLGSELTLQRDTKEMLEKMAKQYLLFLLTNSSSRYARAILARHGIEGVFTRIITSDDGFESKGEAIAAIAGDHAETPRDVTYLGDTAGDVICGKNAGCRVIIVYMPWSWDWGRLREIEAAGPDAVVDCLQAAKGVLDRKWK